MSFKNLLLLLALTALSISALAQHIAIDPVSGKYGFEDDEGRVVVPFEFDGIIPHVWDTLMMAKRGGFWSTIDGAGRTRVPFEFADVRLQFEQGLPIGGFAAVSHDKRIYGLANCFGKMILPEKYEMVRAIFPDLLVAQAPKDSMLQFFDAAGQPLFSIAGDYPRPGCVPGSIEIYPKKNGPKRLIDRQGKWIFGERFQHVEWTDGERFILGKPPQTGMINAAGDTILPFAFYSIKAFEDGFFLTEVAREKKVFDGTGRSIFPGKNYSIMRAAPRSGAAWLIMQTVSGTFGDQIWDARGEKLLFEKCMARPLTKESTPTLPDQHFENYFRIQRVGLRTRMGLCRADGSVILPEDFQSIQYTSDRHALIAFLSDAEQPQKSRCLAFDLQGKELLPRDFIRLEPTQHPRVLYAQQAKNKNWGVIDLDNPAATRFEFEHFFKLENHYWCGKKGQKHALFNPKGRKIYEGELATLKAPTDYVFTAAFKKTPGTSGRLVAIAQKNGRTSATTFIGINHEGREFLFDINVMDKLPSAEALTTPEPVVSTDSGLGPDAFQEEPDEAKTTAEKMPEYPGGEKELFKFLSANLKYPAIAVENAIQGTVVVQFIVESDGRLTQVEIVRDIGGGCGAEAKRLVESMPKWKPAMDRGQNVRTRYTLPVKFRLE